MSLEMGGRTYTCERCGEVTREEVDKCPQNGCPARKLVQAGERAMEPPLVQAVAMQLNWAADAPVNPYAFSAAKLETPPVMPSSEIARAYAAIFAVSLIAYLATFGLIIWQAEFARENRLIKSLAEGSMMIASLAGFAAFIVLQIWLAKTWSLVPDHHGRLNPVAVIVLQFVPCFNLYWWFRIGPGLSTALTNMRREQEPQFENRGGFWLGVLSTFFGFLTPFWVLNADRVKNQYLAALVDRPKSRKETPIGTLRPNYWGD